MAEPILMVGSSAENLSALPDPKSLKVLLQDIDAGTTTRSANGTMLRDRVCGAETAKRKLEIEWVPLKPEPTQQILQAIKDVFFYVKYPDPYTSSMRTARFYAGDRSVPMYHFDLNGQGIVWESVKVNLIEE